MVILHCVPGFRKTNGLVESVVMARTNSSGMPSALVQLAAK